MDYDKEIDRLKEKIKEAFSKEYISDSTLNIFVYIIIFAVVFSILTFFIMDSQNREKIETMNKIHGIENEIKSEIDFKDRLYKSDPNYSRDYFHEFEDIISTSQFLCQITFTEHRDLDRCYATVVGNMTTYKFNKMRENNEGIHAKTNQNNWSNVTD